MPTPSMYQAESDELARRKALADMLQQQSMQPIETQSVGGIPTPISPLQGLSKLYQGYQGGKEQKEVTQGQQDLSKRYQEGLAEALRKSQETGSPDALLMSGHPLAQQIGMSRMTADQAAKAATDKMNAEYSMKKQFETDPDVIAAKQRGSSKSDYFVPVQTAGGVISFDSRRGSASPLMVGGKQVVGSASDPTLQGNIAYGKAEGKERGESLAKSDIMLPQVIANAQQSNNLIDQMIGSADGKVKPHPGFSSTVGGTLRPGARLIEGTPEAGFMAILDQIKGGAFLEAFNSLKGGGQITEVEGRKATDAITRMKKSQSEDEFVKAAREYQSVINAGVQRALQKAGKINETSPAVAKPTNVNWSDLK